MEYNIEVDFRQIIFAGENWSELRRWFFGM
jgi:hypothetical protein